MVVVVVMEKSGNCGWDLLWEIGWEVRSTARRKRRRKRRLAWNWQAAVEMDHWSMGVGDREAEDWNRRMREE